MKDIGNNGQSSGTTKRNSNRWGVFRDRIKEWWMQWPYDNFGENELDRYYRIEHWREHQIRRQDIENIFTRR